MIYNQGYETNYYKIANFVVMLLKMHDPTTMIMITMMLNHE